MEKRKKVAFYTLGCKVNQYETEALKALLREKGYEIARPQEPADIYIINTCTVTNLAERKSRQIIRRCSKENPQARVVVMGCYAQISPGQVREIAGVDLVVGVDGRKEIPAWLEETENSKGVMVKVTKNENVREFEEIGAAPYLSKRVRAYLKVQEGCDQFCSYCIIPYARGPLRSRPVEKVLAEAGELIAKGYREIVLVGIHLGAYGRDFGKELLLETLLEKLLNLTTSVRWRLSSLEPVEVNGELIRLMEDYDNFCPHLHLPLQSAHDDILKSMNRPYTTEQYRNIVEGVRKRIPDICITTDIMVGFPGETQEHFRTYVEFVKEMGFGGIHVFQYSPRKGTLAADFPKQVPAAVKAERSSLLIDTAGELAFQYAARFAGKKLQVLLENPVGQNIWEGHSENYLPVRCYAKRQQRGQIVPVKITKNEGKICFGVKEV